MKYLLIILLLTGIGASAQTEHKIDSSLRYRWENSSRDSLQWPLTYGWYDTLKEEESLYALDTIAMKRILIGWYINERYPPPPNCRCIGKYFFKEYLDADKKPLSKNIIVWQVK